MKNLNLIVIQLIFSSFAIAEQSFEGIITYKIELQSRSDDLPIDVLRQNYGDGLEVFYKYGYKKDVSIGGAGEWEIYDSTKNKQYLKMRNNSEVEVFDGGDESRKLKGIVIQDTDFKVLNRATRLVTIQYQDGSESKYWFSPEIYIDPSQFQKLEFGYLNRYWDIAKAPYLRHERDHGEWVVTHVAVGIEKKSLDATIFSVSF